MDSFLFRHRKVILHVSFWCVYASFFFYQITFGRRQEPEWGRIIPDFAFHISTLLVISYLNYFFFLPELLTHKRLGRYMLRFMPVLLIAGYLILLGKRIILTPFVSEKSWVFSSRFGINVMLSTLFIVVFVGLLRFVEDYFENETRRKEMQNQQLTSELRFLRAQVNPHFLFNTLNNLYYLALNQSPNTPDVIAKLSSMMRYMLYDSNHPKVPLKKEIEYMENYLSLEKLRLNEEIPIELTVEGDIEGAYIAPLILITFLENAFKHGVGNNRLDSWITIHIAVRDGYCIYEVRNSKIDEREKTVTEKSGIGLKNASRRLELAYPEKHQLTVDDGVAAYSVKLELDLV